MFKLIGLFLTIISKALMFYGVRHVSKDALLINVGIDLDPAFEPFDNNYLSFCQSWFRSIVKKNILKDNRTITTIYDNL